MIPSLLTGTPAYAGRGTSSSDLDSDSASGGRKSPFSVADEESSLDSDTDAVVDGHRENRGDKAESEGADEMEREWGTDEDFGTQDGYFNAAAPLEYGSWSGPLPLVPWETEISFNENSSQLFGIGDKTASAQYKRIATEAPRFMLGPMPVAAFTETFLKFSDLVKQHKGQIPQLPQNAFRKVPASEKSESLIYNPLMDAMNNPQRCPGITFKDTSNRPDQEQGERGSCKPDLCGYRDEHLKFVKRPGKAPSTVAVTHMGYAMLPIEVKKNDKHDPFEDPPPTATPEERAEWQFVLPATPSPTRNSDMTHALGQCVKYATEMLARQHRHCCYTVCVFGAACVRLIRWDRAGAIVTEAFSLHKSPQLLGDFLWAYGMQTDAMKGYDLSVRPANDAETQLFKEVISDHIRVQLTAGDVKNFESALQEHYKAGSVTVMRIPVQPDASDAQGALYFNVLVCRPVVYPLSITGRETRGYWAVYSDPRAEPHRARRVCFLKDTWRYNARIGDDTEAEVLRTLARKNVENVPQVVHFGDIPMYEYVVEDEDATLRTLESQPWQVTATQEYLDAQWLCSTKTDDRRITVHGHTHHRMTLNIAGYPLLRFVGSLELVKASRNVLQALLDAWDKADRFHRDISAMNIILCRDGPGTIRRAYLIDWDLSRTKHAQAKDEYPISACWQFACAELCTGHRGGPVPTHKLEYDVESLIWVILYCAVMWLPHNMSPNAIEVVIKAIFDEVTTYKSGEVVGGGGKTVERSRRAYTRDFKWTCNAFDKWLSAMLNLLPLLARTSADQTQLHTPVPAHRTSPPARVPEPTRWHLLDVTSYWDDFIKRNSGELPPTDRRFHVAETTRPKLSHTARMEDYAPTTPAPTPTTGKRDLTLSDAAGTLPSSKRQRQDRD